MIFGPIDQVGWASAWSTVTSAEIVERPTPERPAARRDEDARHLTAAVDRRAEALVHRAMLGVDRDDLGARHPTQRLHDRPGRDQTLLVGQGESLARAQRRQRDREAGEADHRVDDDIGAVDEVAELVDDRGERQRVGDLGPT